jgi:hypothetical protein
MVSNNIAGGILIARNVEWSDCLNSPGGHMNCKRPRALVTAALILTLPLAAAAQTPSPLSDAAPLTKPTQQNGPTSSQGYLNEAARVFETIPQASLKDEAQKRFAALRKHFAGLISTYNKNSDPFVYPAVPQSDDYKSTKKDEAVNWKMAFTEVENDLAGILGGGATLPAPGSTLPATAPSAATGPVMTAGTVVTPGSAGVQGTTGQIVQTPEATQTPQASQVPQATPAPPGAIIALPGTAVATDARSALTPTVDPTTGIAVPAGSTAAPTNAAGTTTAPQTAQLGAINAGILVGAIGVQNLDPAVRRQLEQFRLDVELFFAATTMNLQSETAR